MALTDEQRQELARAELAKREMAKSLSSRRLANRLTREGPVMIKQRFIDDFLANDKLSDYPLIAEDVADEDARAAARECASMTMREALVDELRHAFSVIRAPKDVDPAVLAFDLLRSEHGSELTRLKDLDPSKASVELVLAHLESLAYGLSPRLAVSVARRMMLMMLRRGDFKPDGRRRKR